MTEQTATEGPRAFTRWLEKLGDGQANADLSQALFELGGVLRKEALEGRGEAKGELSLSIKFKVDAFGQVITTYAIKLKEPEPARPSSMFWLTKGGNFTIENPRQTTLPLREVVNQQGQIVDPETGELRPAREV